MTETEEVVPDEVVSGAVVDVVVVVGFDKPVVTPIATVIVPDVTFVVVVVVVAAAEVVVVEEIVVVVVVVVVVIVYLFAYDY